MRPATRGSLTVIVTATGFQVEKYLWPAKYIGDNGIKVITRLMGLILAVIGVQMLIHGIGGAVMDFQGLGAG